MSLFWACRLLERLREGRWAEWRAGLDREVEESALDSYPAQWARGAGHRPYNGMNEY